MGLRLVLGTSRVRVGLILGVWPGHLAAAALPLKAHRAREGTAVEGSKLCVDLQHHG